MFKGLSAAYLSFHEIGKAAQGDGRAVGLAHEEPLEDDGIKVALGPPDQETVQLHSSIAQTQIKTLACIQTLNYKERYCTSTKQK